MKYRTKLILGFAAMLALLIVFAFIVFLQLSMMNKNMHDAVGESYAMVKLSTTMNMNLSDLSTEMNESLLDQDASLFQKRQEAIDSDKVNLNANLAELHHLVSVQPESKDVIGRIDFLYSTYIDNIDKVLGMLKSGDKAGAVKWHNNHNEDIREQLHETLDDFSQWQGDNMEASLNQSSNTYQDALRFILVMVILAILLGVGIATGVIRSLTSSLGRIITVMERAARSESTHLPRLYSETMDDLGKITYAYNQMATSLEISAAEAQRQNQLLEQQSWHKSKVAEITTLYQPIQDLESLADLFIRKISAMMEANCGIFYIKQENDSMPPRLVKLASYAGSREDIGELSFAMGEGLVGQCAMENRMIKIDNPPSNYMLVRSGLGSAVPAQIVIVPVQFKEEVTAVIELASFNFFTESQLALLDELIVTLGITIQSISGHMQVIRLLEEAQIYAEELQAQAEELQVQQEELKALNEQIEEQYMVSESKSKELEKTKDELEEMNKQIMLSSGYKSEFLANMSHELRTPLNSLLILSQMMSENKEGNFTPKQLEYIRTIYASGSDLLRLINEVLDLSKIESGTIEIFHEPVNLKDIADMAERHFSAVGVNKDIEFSIAMEDSLKEITIYSDRQKLQQIIVNLLSNAFKFTDMGSVMLEFRYADGSDVPDHPVLSSLGTILAIIISDTGIGIASDKQAIIFDAFQQADGTTSRKYGGTGLGLSISQRIAGLLGGVIRVVSEEGKGSTFTVYLPLEGADAAVGQAHYTQEAAAALAYEGTAGALSILNGNTPSVESDDDLKQLRGVKILLVDDDVRNIYVLTTVLESYGITVVFAENGEEGLQLLDEHADTSVVLMDIMMPGLDGYEAMRKIREQSRYKDLPIIALTAKAMKHDREKCFEAGANDYISKPVDLGQLLSMIRVWLHR